MSERQMVNVAAVGIGGAFCFLMVHWGFGYVGIVAAYLVGAVYGGSER
jgi:hypothetical protein